MIGSLLIFLVILSVVIFVHEFGHLVAAKMFGVLAEEFGLGLPPRAMRLFKKGETEYTLNWLPIGGFVRLYGENGELSPAIPDRRAFWSRPIWQRGVILLAGVFMNFCLGTFLFGVVYTILGIPTQTETVIVAGLEASGPADSAGIKVGDRLEELRLGEETVKVTSSTVAVDWLYQHQGAEATAVLSREGESVETSLTLREDPDHTKGVMGVVLDDTQLIHYPLWQMPFRGIWFGLQEAVAWGREILFGLGDLVKSLIVGRRIPEGLSGPIGIYQLSSQVANEGILVMLKFIGVLSINLAILNVLPIPALDGGRVAFLVVEAITRRKVAARLEGWVNTIGMFALLAFMAVITLNDLVNLGLAEKIAGLFSQLKAR